MKESDLAEVASDPVLHTVNKFKKLASSPLAFVTSASHSAPCLPISLFRPTSSSATACPSRTSSSAISRALFLSVTLSSRTRLSLRVAAPRLTAVGRAVKRKSSCNCTCAFRDSGEDKKSGAGDVLSARESDDANARAASDAMAGAPRIWEMQELISPSRLR